MPDPAYAPNHSVNKDTGFIESTAYPYAFDANKKVAFLKLFYDSGLKFYRTCAELGVKHNTVHKHLSIDPVFKDAFEQLKTEYYDELEGISRINALNPKSVIERIFQLKAAFPSKYGDVKSAGAVNVTLNIDGETIKKMIDRNNVIEAEQLQDLARESNILSATKETREQ